MVWGPNVGDLVFNLWQIIAEAKLSRGPIVAAWRAGTFAVVGEFDDFEESEVRWNNVWWYLQIAIASLEDGG